MIFTQRDQIAAAFPAHFQRIVECTTAQGRAAMLDEDAGRFNAARALEAAFDWGLTEEGRTYWCALHHGATEAT